MKKWGTWDTGWLALGGVIFILVAAIWIEVSDMSRDQQYYEQHYGAAEEYTVTGTVHEVYTGYNQFGGGSNIVIETDDELPDGTHSYIMQRGDMSSKFSEFDGDKVIIRIGPDGKVVSVKENHFEEAPPS